MQPEFSTTQTSGAPGAGGDGGPDQPPKLSDVVNRVLEISTLPQVALKVIEVAKDPDAGAGDLKNVVEGDPALSVRVLRMVNSAAYGVPCKITNLHQAISYLGFTQIRNLAMTASVSEVFKAEETVGTYRRSALWRHLVSVGIAARLIASRRRLANFEDAFLAGLLHDIGIILEDQHAHEWFGRVIEGAGDGVPLVQVEQQVLGFDHTRLGDRIAEKWKFPQLTRDAIRWHHDSLQFTGEGAEIVRCVEIANAVCSLKGITSVGRRLAKPSVELFHSMGFQKEDILVLASDLDRELKLNESLFEL